MKNSLQIRRGCNKDRPFLDHLQKLYDGHLGYLPRVAQTWYLENQCVKVICENGQPAGYILSRSKLRCQPIVAPIFQAAIAMDAQRRHLGLSLVREISIDHAAAGAKIVQCWCAADLEANSFWKAAGFRKVMTRQPENCRQRRLHLWRKALSAVTTEELFAPPPRAGHQAQRIDQPLHSLLSTSGRLLSTAAVVSAEEFAALHPTSAD